MDSISNIPQGHSARRMTLNRRESPSVSNPSPSPSYARVVLGEEIRRQRIAQGLTQAELGAYVPCTQPKIANLENAWLQKIKLTELNRILEKLGFQDDKAEELRSYARSPYAERGVWVDTANNSTWWHGKARAERLARTISSFQLEVHDGLTQCRAYMERLFELADRTDITAATKMRLSRQADIFDQDNPPECTFVLSEACLHRDMGSPGVMAQQLKHILELSKKPHITFLVVPYDAVIPAQSYGFTLMQFGSTIMTDFALVEHDLGATLFDEDDVVRRYVRRLMRTRSGALNEYDSRKMIRGALRRIQAKLKG
jgi:transcriptional regulator with XRE-family HTH domain